jgi:hypothetical protein
MLSLCEEHALWWVCWSTTLCPLPTPPSAHLNAVRVDQLGADSDGQGQINCAAVANAVAHAALIQLTALQVGEEQAQGGMLDASGRQCQ